MKMKCKKKKAKKKKKDALPWKSLGGKAHQMYPYWREVHENIGATTWVIIHSGATTE